MRILGISGAFDTEADPYLSDLPPRFFHDSAAALVVDGVVVAAVEEERLNREKHSNRFPVRAIGECLAQGGISLGDVDRVAYFFEESFTDEQIATECAGRPGQTPVPIRDLIAERLEQVGPGAQSDRIHFRRHHEAHAASALRYADGPCLVLVMDGNGEQESTSVFCHDGSSTALLGSHPVGDSLGHFYTELTSFLGFGDFDEYKVMGLAAYGDAAPALPTLRPLLSLGEGGRFSLDRVSLDAVLTKAGYQRRTAGEPVEAGHAAVAAAGQRLVEEAVLHVARHWSAVAGVDALCVTGGVAQNTSLNGRLLRDGSFRQVIVDPAGHDGGAALGAALAESAVSTTPAARGRTHLYLGPSVGTAAQVERLLADWQPLIKTERPTDLAASVADLLVDGSIVGWVQGRSEFGPRALGNRSILADPRPAANRERVNALIKERESFRPLAPAVLAGAEREFFAIPPGGTDLRFMGFVVDVLPEARDRLQAVTHVDGTARVQVVDPRDNPLFAGLLSAFQDRSGVPVLLNTSFNTNAEPIVQSLDDAIACLLTSRLDAVAVGPFLVRSLHEADAAHAALRTMSIALQPLCEISIDDVTGGYLVRRRGRPQWTTGISAETALLLQVPGSVMDSVPAPASDEVLADLLELWRRRLILVTPPTRKAHR